MSKKSKLTPWFGGEVMPARAGVYHRRVGVGLTERDGYEHCHGGFAHWNGWRWSPCRSTPEAALKASNRTSGFKANNLSVWRGLARKPRLAGHT